jgi:hypothetical protein
MMLHCPEILPEADLRAARTSPELLKAYAHYWLAATPVRIGVAVAMICGLC